jgi:acetate kinase
MPKRAFLYSIPYELYENHKIRKYGFHGTSHKYVSACAAELLGKPYEELKIITCHLGNGASICAVKNGRSVDTSMGFTPLEGLVMGTRSGDIDPAVIPFIMQKEGLTAQQVLDVLNKKSGVLGVSGVSSDFRDIGAAKKDGNERAEAALEAFYYRAALYIGAYAAAMNGVDAIVFTAGVGENDITSREKICEYLGYLGVAADPQKNNTRGKALDFSADGARVRTLVIPTNEELVIARDTKAAIQTPA